MRVDEILCSELEELGPAIAAGDPAFGTIPVEPGPVLHLALEDTPRWLQARMRTVLAGRDAPGRAHPVDRLPAHAGRW